MSDAIGDVLTVKASIAEAEPENENATPGIIGKNFSECMTLSDNEFALA
nr:hypothetical protein [Agrobacterium larrymoorei]